MKTRIILASQSPRRIQLLKEAGARFEVFVPDVYEVKKSRETPSAMVARLARTKAQAVKEQVRIDGATLIIAADTTVVHPTRSKVLGKPASARHAEEMLKQIVGRTHTVLTGYCLLLVEPKQKDRLRVRVVRTQVKMRKIDLPAIKRYIATGEPMDKAGAYAAQGLGMSLIESLNGSYSNVVGLPISEVVRDLEDWIAFKSYGNR